MILQIARATPIDAPCCRKEPRIARAQTKFDRLSDPLATVGIARQPSIGLASLRPMQPTGVLKQTGGQTQPQPSPARQGDQHTASSA